MNDTITRPFLWAQVGLLVTLICSLLMTGMVWYVQVIQYPLFELVGQENWVRYEAAYTLRAGYLIAPVMLVELVAGIVSLFGQSIASSKAMIVAAILLVSIWGSTFLIQVPLHQQLATSWNPETWQSLVNSNWFRVFAWSLRSFLLIYIFKINFLINTQS